MRIPRERKNTKKLRTQEIVKVFIKKSDVFANTFFFSIVAARGDETRSRVIAARTLQGYRPITKVLFIYLRNLPLESDYVAPPGLYDTVLRFINATYYKFRRYYDWCMLLF